MSKYSVSFIELTHSKYRSEVVEASCIEHAINKVKYRMRHGGIVGVEHNCRNFRAREVPKPEPEPRYFKVTFKRYREASLYFDANSKEDAELQFFNWMDKNGISWKVSDLEVKEA